MSSRSRAQADTTQKSHFFKGSYRLVVKPFTEACECPVCFSVFRDDEDLNSFLKFGACSSCVDIYYYPNADRWDEGWRPKIEQDKK